MSRNHKTANKYYTLECPSCGNPHSEYTGKLDKNKIEYVICGSTHKSCYIRNPVWVLMEKSPLQIEGTVV